MSASGSVLDLPKPFAFAHNPEVFGIQGLGFRALKGFIGFRVSGFIGFRV